ncbi:uncharacterized protein K441DRAFT_16393 [Cenococcum geophilum 1.58]|uniref:uncharacterized protein n=1 Tax=Cenococcum geophilum 1.58 TaxID=794803 RepID=UPI00358E9766|nr:hypothetical protein K441DRAFT_16393 [Cenococcum geophilum 1.58]
MKSLLDLPREIRDIIYELVLASKIAAPFDPPASYTYYTPKPYENYCPTSFSLKPLRPASYGLLLVNHKVSQETREAIRRLASQTRLHYRLDCFFFTRPFFFHPTWIEMPAFIPRIDNIDVDFRFTFAACANLGPDSPNLKWLLRAQSFLEFIRNFADSASTFNALTTQKFEGSSALAINTVTINVVPPPLPSEKHLHRGWETHVTTLSKTRAGEMAGYLASGLHLSLKPRGPQSSMKLRPTLTYGINCLRLVANGRIYLEADFVKFTLKMPLEI